MKSPKLKIIDWYIIRTFIGTYFLTLLIVIVIIVVFDISEKINHFVDNQVPLKEIVFDYFANFIPYIINMYSPMFVFITVIFFTSKLAQNSEIIAMLSNGIGFNRLLVPYLLSATFVAIFSLVLNLYVIPPANKVRLDFENKYIKAKSTLGATRDVHYQLEPGEFVYVESFSSWNNTAYRFTLETIDENKIMSKLTAETAVWDTTFNGWKLHNYFIRKYDQYGNESVTVGRTRDTVIDLTLEDFVRRSNVMQTLTVKELDQLIETQKIRGDKSAKFSLIEKYSRTALPFSAFILTIMGLALSSRKRRGGLGLNIGIGVALCFSYILFQRFSEMFVRTDLMPPFVAIWLPNVVFTIIVIYLYRLAPK